MPILIEAASGPLAVEPITFSNEAELGEILSKRPELLGGTGIDELAFVEKEVDLPDAGYLDLLFVSRAGLPVAVEVKLARNGESRRQIVAQIVDYLSALTALTVDELDTVVEGKLEGALRSFDTSSGSTTDFEQRWRTLGVNLRAGLARIILVLDDVPPELERIVRFLSVHSNLDIELVKVTKYGAGAVGNIFVPLRLVSSTGEVAPRPSEGPKEAKAELLAIVSAYDKLAAKDRKTRGGTGYYRYIKPESWPSGLRIHYEFMQVRGAIRVDLHLESDEATFLSEVLQPLSKRTIGPTKVPLEWDQTWSKGRGRLTAQFSIDEQPDIPAKAMIDLIQMTESTVASALRSRSMEKVR